jgi:hypothetical protein
MSWHGCGVCAELRAVKMCGGRFRVEVGWETRLGLGAKMVRSHGCGMHMSASFGNFIESLLDICIQLQFVLFDA